MKNIELLDGAMGSEFIKRGISLPNHIWSAYLNLEASEVIHEIHKEYLNAGADYLTTNTFRSSPRAYSKIGLSMKEAKKAAELSLKSAIKIAKNAANKNTKILGSIAPLEDCYTPSLFPGVDTAKKEFRELGRWFHEENIDIFLLETMNNLEETITAIDAIKDFNTPIWVSFVLKDSHHILSGDLLSEALKKIESTNCVKRILLNCNPLPKTNNALKIMSNNCSTPWGIYPNLGIGEPSPDGNIENIYSDKEFLEIIESSIKLGATITGGCCGSSPKHIKLLKNSLC